MVVKASSSRARALASSVSSSCTTACSVSTLPICSRLLRSYHASDARAATLALPTRVAVDAGQESVCLVIFIVVPAGIVVPVVIVVIPVVPRARAGVVIMVAVAARVAIPIIIFIVVPAGIVVPVVVIVPIIVAVAPARVVIPVVIALGQLDFADEPGAVGLGKRMDLDQAADSDVALNLRSRANGDLPAGR